MDFFINQMMKFEHIHIAHIHALTHLFARLAIIKLCFAICINFCQSKKFIKLLLLNTLKHWNSKLNAIAPIFGVINQAFIIYSLKKINHCFIIDIHNLRDFHHLCAQGINPLLCLRGKNIINLLT